jgi:hypothetical protein
MVDTPLGRGMVLFVEQEAEDTFWTIGLSECLGIVTFTQEKIRLIRNYSLGRSFTSAELREIIKKEGKHEPKT